MKTEAVLATRPHTTFTRPVALSAVAVEKRTNPFPTVDQIPEEALPHRLDQREYLLNGRLENWSGKLQEVVSPIPLNDGTGTTRYPTLGSYPWMTSDLAVKAVDAAAKAYDHGAGPWPSTTAEMRILCTEVFIEKMIAVREQVVKLLMWEIGKTRKDAEKEFDRTVDYIRDSIKELRKLDAEGKQIRLTGGFAAQVGRTPLGVTLAMGPFNYPLNETFTTIIPALLTGNTVVFKPPKIGVLLYQPLLKAFAESFPAGVVNTVYGDGQEVVTPIMKDGRVDVLAFIGSTRVADIISRQHPTPHRLRMVLGLGAKNPGVVLADADIDKAVDECVTGALSFNGQRCTALKVLFVHRSIAKEFVAKFSKKVSALRRGLPWEDGVHITPLAEPNKAQDMRALIDDAVTHGAKVANPGGGEAQGTLFAPAVLYPVSPQSRLYREEQFGPVVPIVPFDSTKEVVDYMQGSEVGQQVAIFGNDADAIQALVQRTRNLVSRVNINTQCQRGPDDLPFTGKRSAAMGTLSIRDALLAFSIESVIAGRDTESNRALLAAE